VEFHHTLHQCIKHDCVLTGTIIAKATKLQHQVH